LGFNWGVDLPDPEGVLEGSGRRVRHIRISQPADLEKPIVRRLVRAAAASAERPDLKKGQGATPGGSVVRAVYARRRRPAQKKRRLAKSRQSKESQKLLAGEQGRHVTCAGERCRPSGSRQLAW